MVNPDYQKQVLYPSHKAGWEGFAGRAGEHLQKTPPVLRSKDPSSPSLILIGAVHGDPLGYARAFKLLRRLQPDLVTVEVSRFSLRYRERQESRWQRLLEQALEGLPAGAAGHLAIRRLAAQVALPFEVRVASGLWSTLRHSLAPPGPGEAFPAAPAPLCPGAAGPGKREGLVDHRG